ncbi:26S proteasome regulatory subunit 7-like [Triticum dicoccoides]|uniref:26S proteasome regulatory subunit 7-like n=1 Tax=Triticum dicoccoides TaxID=85692 RepID=UPI000E7C189F|nr:26S proteasome regulatory subunit 7-like [Triticum dicoccoides]
MLHLLSCDVNKVSTSTRHQLIGIKRRDTGLAPPRQWDLVPDKQMMLEEQPLQCDAGQEEIQIVTRGLGTKIQDDIYALCMQIYLASLKRRFLRQREG